jgi:hypothetical protein
MLGSSRPVVAPCAHDLIGMNFELRPRIDFGGGREQQAAAGLLRLRAWRRR